MGRDRASRPEAKPLRLFAAADIPEDHRTAVEELIGPWRERLPGGRWDPPEKWHVTLKFLGRTWPRLVERVEEACRETAASVEPFEARLTSLGVFPSPGRARVLWVGLDDRTEGLRRLAAGLDERLASEFEPEKRAFTPHLTVARFRDPVRIEDPEALRRVECSAPPFEVDRLVLYRSHLLGPRGSRYEAVGEFPLGA
ncbi:MAG TPA: RNA 2',3'-cyclic phosphodiesterase [Actinomycetota bacterium]